jgi:hypothetical protein
MEWAVPAHVFPRVVKPFSVRQFFSPHLITFSRVLSKPLWKGAGVEPVVELADVVLLRSRRVTSSYDRASAVGRFRFAIDSMKSIVGATFVASTYVSRPLRSKIWLEVPSRNFRVQNPVLAIPNPLFTGTSVLRLWRRPSKGGQSWDVGV